MMLNEPAEAIYPREKNLLTVSGIGLKEGSQWLLQHVSFTVAAAQKLAIAGATGSGKTTLLKIISGLIQPTEGVVLFEGQPVKGPQEKLIPGHPAIAYLSQHFELRNNYRVGDVLAMANKLSDAEAKTVYALCRVESFLQRRTHQLSGGERQRIALARTLVAAPQLLLLDEPYSNLDPIHKNILKKVIDSVSEELKLTTILVSHDPLDTVSWGDEILILGEGKTIQKGPPETVYRQPINEYAASLFGKYSLLTPSLAKAFDAFTQIEMKDINRFLRPENFCIAQKGEGVLSKVEGSQFMGAYYEVEVSIDGSKIILHTYKHNLKKGDAVYAAIKPFA